MHNERTQKILEIIFYAIIGLVITLMLGDMVSAKLVDGARWSSGLPLGGVDNWLNEGGSLYTIPEKGFTPGSSYFPGIVLLSLLYRVLFGYGAETALIITGGVIALLSCWGFARIVTEDSKRIALLTLIALEFLRKMYLAPTYLLEMHPDIPALMCMTWGIIAMHKYISKRSKVQFVLATLSFIGAGLFKQNAVAMYVGIGIFTLLTRELDVKTKIRVILSEFIAGVCVLLVVFSIDGCWLNCVTVNASHSLLSLNEYIAFGISALKHNKLFLGLIVIYVLQRLLLSSPKELISKMYIYAALFWTIFCMYGAAKDGANEGNMEAAIIALMPFVLLLFDRAFIYIKEHMSWNVLYESIKGLKGRKFKITCSIVLIVCICAWPISRNCYRSYKHIKGYQTRIHQQNEFAQWLTDNYKGCNVAYNTIQYEILNNALIHKTSDLYTILVWEMGGYLSDEKICQLMLLEKWDVILSCSPLDEARWPLTFSYFHQLEEGIYPDAGMKVYVKRNSRYYE